MSMVLNWMLTYGEIIVTHSWITSKTIQTFSAHRRYVSTYYDVSKFIINNDIDEIKDEFVLNHELKTISDIFKPIEANKILQK
uniref:Uncharacterized protein n=1 Tax=Lactuca sativa TaxID=4236 RepID=A0A9R1XBR7_LACSA|nr:hypothetical protein LSAT_V11C500284680 [Lactuca sativa]